MVPREALTINGRRSVSLKSEFRASPSFNKSPTNKQQAFTWARAGRQNSEGFGGGRIISK